MDEREYWGRLEFRLGDEFAQLPEGHFRDYWCDGFSPESYLITGRRPRILGEAWICDGEKTMDKWNFELRLPQRVNSQDKIDWAVLLPRKDVTGWLEVNKEREFIRIRPPAVIDLPK